MRAPTAAVAALLLITPAAAARAIEPDLDAFVDPVRAEAGPILSPAIGPIPRSGAWATESVRYASRGVGRTTYEVVQTALVLGGEWSPKRLRRLGLGGDLVAFQTTTLMTELPPLIDEKRTSFDLGVLRLRARLRAFELARATPRKGFRFELALTPFFSLGLPTDTSRTRWERRMPIRGALDDRVIDGPYVLVEPGAAFGMTLGVFSFFSHQGWLFAPIAGADVTHFVYSMHYGLAARIAGVVELSTELDGLLRFTRGYEGERLYPWAFSPGVRFLRGDWAFELSARVGLNADAHDPYGDITVGLGVAWRPSPRARRSSPARRRRTRPARRGRRAGCRPPRTRARPSGSSSRSPRP
jgi:hypothetical protein